MHLLGPGSHESGVRRQQGIQLLLLLARDPTDLLGWSLRDVRHNGPLFLTLCIDQEDNTHMMGDMVIWYYTMLHQAS